ncbi:hypothetical protein B566_EDAN012766 [Ephemera danica]|nr:hypothetical protein B566_EDAN012766 [Ephemera danica]
MPGSAMEHSQAEKLKHIVNQLYDVGGLKFGDFVMKSGQNSPVYIDLRESVALLMWELKGEALKYDSICGVPYNALPIASIIAVKNNIPMLIRRKEAKSYGTKKLIEGIIKTGDQCVIIEDVVTTGSSILETVKDLQREGLTVTDAIVIVDREQGGEQILLKNGIKLHICPGRRLTMTYEERAAASQSEVSRALMKLMVEKKSNLCVAADVGTSSELLSLAQLVGPYICVLKTHVDTVANFSKNVADDLIELAKKFNFMIMEDRKFADIGSIVAQQYKGGVFEIIRWADLVTAHALPGKGMLQGLQQEAKSISNTNRGCFLLAEMSCAGNLITPEYAQAAVGIAKQWPEMVVGLVCQSPLAPDCPGLLQLTPGVRRGESSDGMGQQWVSPQEAVLTRGADIVVVGRGITKAKDVGVEAKAYQEELWAAYEKRAKK